MRKLRLFLGGRAFPFALALFLFVGIGIALAAWLPRLLAPAAALERLLAAIALVFVSREPVPAEYKLSKSVLVLCLPWTGAVLCLFLRSDGKKDGPPESLSLFPCRLKTAEYFPVGRAMANALLSDLRRAKKFVYLEFYVVAEGVFLGDILEILFEKAERGVDVRLVYDGFGSALTLPPSLVKDAERRGIRTHAFRPLGLPSRDAGRRDHRKLAVIDGEIAYTGGINLADEYIGETVRFGHWKDTAVRVTGGAAARLCALFVSNWNKEEPSRPLPLPDPPSPDRCGKVPCAVVFDDCKSGTGTGELVLLRLVSGAKTRLYLNTPYLAPSEPLLRALQGAARGGVDVRLMIPHVPDKRLPFLLTRSYARELEKSGVAVREYTDGFLHAKSVVSDGTVFVSSYNLDFRSLFLQSECGVAVRQDALSDKLAADFLAAWEQGTPLPAASAGESLLAGLLRLAAPLL